MKPSEMIVALRKTFAVVYDRVSEPQHYRGEGPFLMALLNNQGNHEFHFYEFLAAETFLSAPDKRPLALQEPEFLFKIVDSLNLEGLELAGRALNLILRRIIPYIPACQLAVQNMHRIDSDRVENILFVNDAGKLLPVADILGKTIIFH